ncbi:hypothetical protein [uncultured Tenacibaculum sp.]|uniref:hypothetical protein n=1 Tax=uncultured Tenacibaculum sp. TaxID=174713 RepID=UPI0026262A96|nr:hypothetical protein [uncultured Tenacibaculum sp.]
MKKTIALFSTLLCCLSLFSQGDDYYGDNSTNNLYQTTELLTNPTVQAPNVAAFQKVNFVPVSNYTGRANVSIPVFTIKSGNISIPISLSYNSSGVKVNDIPSSVGSNWSLNAGGVISKVVKGIEDFKSPGGCFPFDFGYYFSDPGYLYPIGRSLIGYCSNASLWGEGDVYPDEFIVNAPGLNTTYTHGKLDTNNDNISDVLELTGQQNKITEIQGEFDAGKYNVSLKKTGSNDHEYIDGAFNSNKLLYGIKNISIVSTNGLLYDFNHKDISQYTYSEQARNTSGGGVAYKPINIISQRKVESYHLSKIKDLKSNKEVVFEYETYNRGSYDPIDNAYFYTGSTTQFYMDAIVKAKSTKYPKINRLTKINYDKGSVEFIYGLNRQDLLEEKALTQIIIKDINGLVIKKINLEYSYMQNSAYASSPQNKRLKLDKVQSSNANNEVLPGYTMSYNTTSLPPRGVWGKDFLGYHNGSYTTSLSDPKPIVYFYPDKGIHSFLPSSKGSGYYLLNGQYSLASNLAYAKAGVLEKIQYPTGGFSEFEHELNQFKIENTAISGGGLRIKTQKIIDELGNEQILDYEYKETDNTSSGAMVSMPNFIDFRVNNVYSGNLSPSSTLSYLSFKTFRTAKTQAEFTNNSFVGYSRVLVKNRINNGYTEYNYSSPKDFPNIMHQSSPLLNTKAYVAKRNGMRTGTFSKEVYRGKLKSSKVYNNTGLKLKETINSYTYKKFEEYTFSDVIRLCGTSQCYSKEDYNGAALSFTHKILSERYLLTSSINTDYLDGGNTSVTKETVYDPTYPLVKENTITDATKEVINKFYYPHDSQVNGQPNMSTLRAQNRYSEMIQQESYHDGQKIFTERINYHNFGNNLYLPNKIYTAKGTQNLEEGAIIDKRDSYGNILQFHNKDGIYTSFIYGYGNTSLLAKIENEKYDIAISKIPITVTALQNLDNQSDENTLIGYFNTMRTALPNARISSYTYIPSVGVSTITDNRGKNMSYVYDNHHRLSLIKDTDGNIIKRYYYNYKNQ